MTVENVDYAQLTANPTLLAAFQESTTDVVASSLGGGVTPEHVSLQLSPGSVLIGATVAPVSGASLAEQPWAELCEGGADSLQGISDALEAELQGIQGISDVVTGAIVVQQAGMNRAAACMSTAGAPPTSQDSDTCSPACHPGHGICSDGVCFCRNPWYGPTCGHQVETGAFRMSVLACIGASVLAAMGGLLLGSLAFRSGQQAKRQLNPLGEDLGENKKEIWMPAGEKKS